MSTKHWRNFFETEFFSEREKMFLWLIFQSCSTSQNERNSSDMFSFLLFIFSFYFLKEYEEESNTNNDEMKSLTHPRFGILFESNCRLISIIL